MNHKNKCCSKNSCLIFQLGNQTEQLSNKLILSGKHIFVGYNLNDDSKLFSLVIDNLQSNNLCNPKYFNVLKIRRTMFIPWKFLHMRVPCFGVLTVEPAKYLFY